MTEEVENESVKEQDIATPVETTESSPTKNNPVTEETEKGTKEYNWRRMEQKLQELERQNQELTQAIQSKNPSNEDSSDDLSKLQEDDLITVGQVKRMAEKRAREIFSEELSKKEKQELPLKVKSQYSDYDQVVNNENIEKLVQERPAWENTIKNDPNPYETAYFLIKQSQFYKQTLENKKNQERIDSNSQKPLSSNAIGRQNPLSQAHAFATQSKEELWAEMQQYSKKAASVPYKR